MTYKRKLIELPPKFAGRPPINPEYRARAIRSDTWTGAKGLAGNVRYYGKWMRDEADTILGQYLKNVRRDSSTVGALFLL